MATAKKTKKAAKTAKTARSAKPAKAPAKKPPKAKKAKKAKKGATKQPARTTFARRADFGAPIDGFFAKQPPHLRGLVEALRDLVEEVAPQATASLKWGMPFYSVGTTMMCAIAGHKSHVNLILAGPPGTFADPDGLLEGGGKTGRHIKLRTLDELPREAVRGWLRTAARLADSGR